MLTAMLHAVLRERMRRPGWEGVTREEVQQLLGTLDALAAALWPDPPRLAASIAGSEALEAVTRTLRLAGYAPQHLPGQVAFVDADGRMSFQVVPDPLPRAWALYGDRTPAPLDDLGGDRERMTKTIYRLERVYDCQASPAPELHAQGPCSNCKRVVLYVAPGTSPATITAALVQLRYRWRPVQS